MRQYTLLPLPLTRSLRREPLPLTRQEVLTNAQASKLLAMRGPNTAVAPQTLYKRTV